MTIDELVADYMARTGRIEDNRQMTLTATPLVRVVGLWSTAPQSGKTTAADALTDATFCHGAQDFLTERVSFAAPLRKAIMTLLVDVLGVDYRIAWAHCHDGPLREVPIPGVGKSFVEIAIKIGTDVGRGWLGEDTWVRPWERRVDELLAARYARVILSDDMRFPNEAAAVRKRGGVLIGIHRPGYGVSAQRAAAEGKLSLDMMDAVITNDGDLETFKRNVVKAAMRLGVDVGPDGYGG